MFTEKQLQKYIDSKDWKTILKDKETLQAFYGTDIIHNITPNKDFIINVLLSDEMIEIKKTIFLDRKSFIFNICLKYSKLSVSDYQEIFDIISKNKLHYECLIFTDKQPGFFKVIANQNALDVYLDFFNGDNKVFDRNMKSYRFKIDCKLLNLLSEDEVKFFIQHSSEYFQYGNYKPKIENLELLFKYFTIDELFKMEQNTTVGINKVDIIKSIPTFEMFYTFFMNLDDDSLLKMCIYWLSNHDADIPDDMLKKFFDLGLNHDLIINIIPNMNKDQILKYKFQIPHHMIFTNSKLSLDDLTDIFPKYKEYFYSILDFRKNFYTDEEIQKYPNLFDPVSVKFHRCLYVSKDTFKLLNKTWGKKQKYDEEIMKLENICKSLVSKKLFTPKILDYLIEKTNPSNIELISTFLKINVKDSDINILSNFIKQYRNE